MSSSRCETVLRGFVYNYRRVGLNEDESGTMDGNPDRDNFSMEAVGCDSALYREWFLEVAPSGICAYGNTMNFAELSPSDWKISDGAVIEIRFSDFLSARLDRLACLAHAEINEAYNQALIAIHGSDKNPVSLRYQ